MAPEGHGYLGGGASRFLVGTAKCWSGTARGEELTRQRVRLAAGTTGVALALVLTGCGDDDVALEDKVLALYMSPQAKTSGILDRTGHVHLFAAEGSVETIDTAVMDVGQLEWTDDGLYFADSENDYRLDGSGLTVTESPKPDMQASLHDMGDVVVGIYNDGLVGELDYRMSLVESGVETSTATSISGVITTVARCDDALYGVGQATGPFLEDHPLTSAGSPAWVVYEVWPGPQRVVGVPETIVDDSSYSSDAPCEDGTFYTLAPTSDDPSTLVDPRHALMSWDTRTGERTETDLVTPAGDRLDLDVDGVWHVDSSSLVDGRLLSLYSDGVVRSTDVATGATEELFATGLTSEAPGSDLLTAFAGDDLYVLHFPGEGGEGDVAFYRYSTESGSEELLFTTSEIDPVVAGNLIPRGLAISPELSNG